MLLKLFEGVIFLLGLSLLVWLGYWQLERAEWKKDIIYKLNQEYRKDAAAYPLTAADLSKTSDDFKVVRGKVKGKFIAGGTTLWPKFSNGFYGFQLVDPLLLPNGKVLMVNRGWVREKLGKREPSAYYLPSADVSLTVIGTVRELESNYFTLENDVVLNRWHRFNTDQLEAYLKVDEVYPMMMFAEQIPGTEYRVLGELRGQNLYPRNKHNQYAVFWFTLSGLWILILGTLLFRRDYSH